MFFTNPSKSNGLTPLEKYRINPAYINLNLETFKPVKGVPYLWVLTQDKQLILGVERAVRYPQAFDIDMDNPEQKKLWDEVISKQLEGQKLGHPTLNVDFAKGAKEGKAYLGGELKFDTELDSWVLDNYSGRYGNFANITRYPVVTELEEQHQLKVVATLIVVKYLLQQAGIRTTINPMFDEYHCEFSQLNIKDILSIVSMEPDMLEYVGEAYRDKDDVVFRAVSKDPKVLEFAHPCFLLRHEPYLRQLFSENNELLPVTIHNFRRNAAVIAFFNQHFRQDMLDHLTDFPRDLYYFRKAFKEDVELIETALAQSEVAIKYASLEFLLQNKERLAKAIQQDVMVLLAVIRTYNSNVPFLAFILQHLKPELVAALTDVNLDYQLCDLPELLVEDEEIVLAALGKKPVDIRYAGKAFLLAHKEQVFESILDNRLVLVTIARRFPKDEEIKQLLEEYEGFAEKSSAFTP